VFISLGGHAEWPEIEAINTKSWPALAAARCRGTGARY
jgi:hypothetical protein